MKLTPLSCFSLVLFGTLNASFLASTAQAESFRPTSIEGRYGTSLSTLSQGTSRVVISVGDGSDRCGSGFGWNAGLDGFGSGLGSGSGDEFDFYRPGRASTASSARSGGALREFMGNQNTFQLPNNQQQPDIVGCIDYSRNIVFINLRPRVIQESTPMPTPVPAPIPTPTPKPITQGSDRSGTWNTGIYQQRQTYPQPQNSNSGAIIK